MRSTPVILLAIAMSAVGVPTAGAETPVASVSKPTEVRAWNGTAVLSVYDASADVYRLAVVRGADAPQVLPIAPRAVPFDADIGPDARGGQAIVYSRCRMEAKVFGGPRRKCDLYLFSPAAGVETTIRTANSVAASEVNPTIWRGRIAWARIVDGRKGAQPVVYTRPLAAPPSQRSRRLPGVPARRCSELPSEGCGPTDAIEPPVLELYGRWLGLIVRYDYRGAGGVCGRSEVRLGTLAGDARQIAAQTCGLDGQSYVGVSFDAGRLYFARFCAANPRGCARRQYGAFRYGLADGRYALAQYGRRLTGFAYAGGGRAYEVRATDTQSGYCGNSIPDEPLPPCELVLTAPLTFAATRAPR